MCMGGVGVALATLATRSGRRGLSARGRGVVGPRRRHGGTTMPAPAQEAGAGQQQVTTTGWRSRGKHYVGHGALHRKSSTDAFPSRHMDGRQMAKIQWFVHE